MIKFYGIKKKIIAVIKYLAVDLDEVTIDIHVDGITFNSIEWRRIGNRVILHKFMRSVDYEFDLRDMDKDTQKEIYLILLRSFFN